MRKRALISAMGFALAAASGGVWAGDTTIGGKTYVDFTSKTNKDEGAGVKRDDTGYGTDVKRFYLGVNHNFDSTWSAAFVSDIGDKGVTGTTAKRYDIFVKKAYLQAAFMPEATLRVGSADMPWIPFVEDVYGYRYVENTLIDRLGFGNSADWGVHFLGKSGIVNYAVSSVNGRGYSDPTRSKSQDIEARVGIMPMPGLTVAVGAYNGKLGKDLQSAPAKHSANRVDALVGYQSDLFRAGVEYFAAKNWTTVTSTSTDKADGFSVWGSVKVADKTAVFARYDTAKPSKTLTPGLKDNYALLGVEYKPNKAVNLAVAYKHEKVKGGTIGTTNGTIGGSAGGDGKYDEIGVWAQFAF